MARSRLGRGLEALIPVETNKAEGADSTLVMVGSIDPNPFQPRRIFDETRLAELADSIVKHGLLQPIIVRKVGATYQLVAGERRLRASKIAGLEQIPCIVRDYDDKQMMELAIVENLQREDLNPIEEALAYRQLMETTGITQEVAAERVGKSRSHVANTIRLLQLPEVIQKYVSRETISAGHARAILSLPGFNQQLEVTEAVIQQSLNVRQTEELVKKISKSVGSVSRETSSKRPASPEIADVERKLQSTLGTNVKILSGKKQGRIEISFYSADDLERIVELLLELQV